MSLTIKTPCQENWNQMKQSQHGKFCAACEQEVVDFARLSLPEIKLYFEQAPDKKTCGRFRTDQLAAFNRQYQLLPTPSRLRAWTTAAVLMAVATVPSFAQAPITLTDSVPILALPVPKNNPSTVSFDNKDQVVISGTIRDADSREGVADAMLVIIHSDDKRQRSITDQWGRFEFTVAPSEEQLTLVIYTENYQETHYHFVPTQALSNLNISVRQFSPSRPIMGDFLRRE